MTKRAATQFQSEATGAAALAAQSAHISVPPQITWIDGEGESYFRMTWHLRDTVEAYVYDDEAGVMIGNRDWTIFERADYESTSELLTQFTGYLKQVLQLSSRPIVE